MGCDIISQGSLCSKERRRRLLALLMKQFIRWGWSYCMLPRQAGGGGVPGGSVPWWVAALRELAWLGAEVLHPCLGGCRGAAPFMLSAHRAGGIVLVCTGGLRCLQLRWALAPSFRDAQWG